MKSYIEVAQFVKSRIKESRYIHSLGVKEVAVTLAKRFGVSEDAAAICAIYHDAYRYSADSNTALFLESNGVELEEEEKEDIVLLHGPLAAFYMRRDVGEDTPDEYIKAVRFHTLGSVSMGALGAIIYIADFTEPGRKHLTEENREFIFSSYSLEEMIIRIMDMQRAYFDKEGIKSAKVSDELYEYIKSGGKL